MDEFERRKVEFAKQLVDTNCLKFGEFRLKSGITSKYYLNLREATMYPEVFHNMVELIKYLIPKDKQPDSWSDIGKDPPVAIVGVPYGIVPTAAAVAYACKLAYYPVRKEEKNYGLKDDQGSFNKHELIIIEDVMSTGSSIVDTIKKLSGKRVTDVVVLVNRKMGGDEKLKSEHPEIRLHSILDISDILKSTTVT